MRFLPESLKKLRNSLGLNQKEMAEKVGMKDSVYRKKEGYDKKAYEPPELKHLTQIAAACGIGLDYFFEIKGTRDESELNARMETMEIIIKSKDETIAALKGQCRALEKQLEMLEGKADEDEDALLKRAK